MNALIYRLFILLPALFFAALPSFTSEAQIPTDSITNIYIQFGSGGGFTATTKNYILTKDRKLFSFTETINSRTANTFVKKVSSCKIKKIASYIRKNGLTTIQYNEPGNTYSYITIIEKETNTLTWNKQDNTPKTIIQLDQLLRSLL